MEIQDFISKLGDVFEDTDLSTLKPETKFRELDDWSSLAALSLIALADEEYDVALKGDDIRNAQTIEDIFNTIKAKL